jgi:hypothetical protein
MTGRNTAAQNGSPDRLQHRGSGAKCATGNGGTNSMLRAVWHWLSAAAGRLGLAGRRSLEVQAAELSADKVYDLVFLHGRGFVQARGTGQSITRVFAHVQNRVERPLRVRALPGTCFIAKGGHQNMVIRRPCCFTLRAGQAQSVAIEATPMNAERPIPCESDHFQGVRWRRQVALDAAAQADAMTVQAGVWAFDRPVHRGRCTPAADADRPPRPPSTSRAAASGGRSAAPAGFGWPVHPALMNPSTQG